VEILDKGLFLKEYYGLCVVHGDKGVGGEGSSFF
jgi:hypothetical protein